MTALAHKILVLRHIGVLLFAQQWHQRAPCFSFQLKSVNDKVNTIQLIVLDITCFL